MYSIVKLVLLTTVLCICLKQVKLMPKPRFKVNLKHLKNKTLTAVVTSQELTLGDLCNSEHFVPPKFSLKINQTSYQIKDRLCFLEGNRWKYLGDISQILNKR